MAPRLTRSKGEAQDPELGPNDFWLPQQKGAKKDKVKATGIVPGSSDTFVTLKVPARAVQILEL